jgi:hypothetical protein
MSDFVDRNDQNFLAQTQRAYNVIGPVPVEYGQTMASMTQFQDDRDTYNNAVIAHVAAKDAAKSATAAKDAARAVMEASYRDLNRVAQATAGVTDAMLADAGLPVHAATRTPGGQPTLRPELQVDVNGQEHNITVINPESLKAVRPADARMIELYRAVVAPGVTLPSSISQMTLAGAFTTSRITLQYEGDDIGKTVVYIARYLGAKNQQGPAGTTSTASIAA